MQCVYELTQNCSLQLWLNSGCDHSYLLKIVNRGGLTQLVGFESIKETMVTVERGVLCFSLSELMSVCDLQKLPLRSLVVKGRKEK